MSVPKFGEAFGISRGTAYKLVKEGKIRAIRLGKRLVIPRTVVEELLKKSNESGQ